MEKDTIYVYLIGGFTDNLKIYNIKETEIGKKYNIIFVIKDAYKSPTRSSNKDLLEIYKFKDIITEDNVPKHVIYATFQPQTLNEIKPNHLYCYSDKKYGKSSLFITKQILIPEMFDLLLHPKKPLSNYIQNVIKIIKQDKWYLLGNRCSYLQKAVHGKDKIERLLLIGDYLEHHPEIKNIVLILDDPLFLNPFKYIFGDILENRNILYLRIMNNCEHEYIQIATYCHPLEKGVTQKFNKFIHDHSGFYSLLESYIGYNLSK